jgi:hypothetical protein
VLETEREQALEQRDDETSVPHEAKDAGNNSRMVTDHLLLPTGQEIEKQVKELLTFWDGPAKGEQSRAQVKAQTAGEVTDLLCPFVKGKTAWALVSFRGTKSGRQSQCCCKWHQPRMQGQMPRTPLSQTHLELWCQRAQ